VTVSTRYKIMVLRLLLWIVRHLLAAGPYGESARDKEIQNEAAAVIKDLSKDDALNRDMSNSKFKPKVSSIDIPMKVANNYTWGNHDQRPDGNCPVCGHNLSGDRNSPKYERCPNCGQKLDWH